MSFRKTLTLAFAVVAVAACETDVTSPPLSEASEPPEVLADRWGQEDVTFDVVAGADLAISPPGNPGGGGFVGPLSMVRGHQSRTVGDFKTDILPSQGVLIYEVLQALTMGEVQVDAVKGVFATRWGSLIDEHVATLTVVPEAPVTPGFDVVVVAKATGVITGGTRRYRRASGTSDLYLKMEVDFDTFSAKALEGSFVFRLN